MSLNVGILVMLISVVGFVVRYRILEIAPDKVLGLSNNPEEEIGVFFIRAFFVGCILVTISVWLALVQ